MTSVLLIHKEPTDNIRRLRERFPDCRFHHAAGPGQVLSLLAAERPEIVLSIKGPDFPGEAHRPAYTFESVKLFQVGGSGYEHILPLERSDVVVTNCRGVLARFLAETVTAAMLSLNGNFPRYAAQQRAQTWAPIAFRPIAGQTILIVGFGAIGRWVARYAKVLGMNVIAIRRNPEADPDVDEIHPPEQLRALVAKADIVSLHVRLEPTTHHMVDAQMLEAMKPGSFLLNTARGGVVDTKALIEALGSGHLAGAYLDVFEQEPLPVDSPLWHLDNVLITPHAADNIVDWPSRFYDFFAENLDLWFAGKAMKNRIA